MILILASMALELQGSTNHIGFSRFILTAPYSDINPHQTHPQVVVNEFYGVYVYGFDLKGTASME